MKKTFATLRLIVPLLAGLSLPVLFGFGSCEPDLNPIIFVHGGSGSGAQFESQAMRFASNGYPQSHIAVVEYDSSSISTILPDVLAAIDALIAELQAATGREQVDLMGHSLGTTVSHSVPGHPRARRERGPLREHRRPERRRASGRRAHPGPLGGGGRPAGQGEIVGAINVTVPNQEHIEVATSAESFFEMYHFLRGQRPSPPTSCPSFRPRYLAGGRPTSPRTSDWTARRWRSGRSTATRARGSAAIRRRRYAIGPDGNLGPFTRLKGGKHYEFAVIRDGAIDLHYFYEPFLRSDHLVRLNAAVGLDPFIESSDNHAAVTVLRYKEFWGDRGAENDVLAIGGTDVINPVTAPSGAVGGRRRRSSPSTSARTA